MTRDFMDLVDGRRPPRARRSTGARSSSSQRRSAWSDSTSVDSSSSSSAEDESDEEGRERTRSRPSLVPKNLASFDNIQDLLPIFEVAIANSSDLFDLVEAPDAVAALNHLKRLQRHTRGKPELERRGYGCCYSIPPGFTGRRCRQDGGQ